MSERKISEKELEALAVMRDIAILLYSEISENMKIDSEYLGAAFNYLDGLFNIGSKELDKEN